MIGIYLHIPFCKTRCPYCDFVSNAVLGPVPEAFVRAVCREIEEFAGPEVAGTVFVGGGTPSLLEPGMLERILAAIRSRFVLDDPEITVEANPDDVTPLLVEAWLSMGVNRISLGVQSFDDGVLHYLGRRHDAARARLACEVVSERCANWGMDLIFGAHPVDAWEATLDTCLSFAPKHVSTYGLTYEAGTPFNARRDEAIDDEAWVRLYRQAEAHLAAYDHYEISNYALPGYACRHNLIYWRNLEYAGFGPAAYSFLDSARSRNHVGLDDYLAAPGEKCEAVRLTDHEIRVETVVQHFRLREGLSKETYFTRFGSHVQDDFALALDRLIARGLIEEDATTFRPTRSGFELNNEIGLTLVD